MTELIEQYKRRIATANKAIWQKGPQAERIKVKISCYRTIITELEREQVRINELLKQTASEAWDAADNFADYNTEHAGWDNIPPNKIEYLSKKIVHNQLNHTQNEYN